MTARADEIAIIIGLETIRRMANDGTVELETVTLFAADDLYGRRMIEDKGDVLLARVGSGAVSSDAREFLINVRHRIDDLTFLRFRIELLGDYVGGMSTELTLAMNKLDDAKRLLSRIINE